MMRRGASFDADRERRQLLEECQHVPLLELTTYDNIPLRIDAVDLKTDFAISRPIVAIVCMTWLLRIVGP
jgi:hypothetical protein